MKRIALSNTLGLVFALGLHVTPAEALPLHTYVKSTGSNDNDCATEATPCRDLNRAIAAAANGATVSCLDSGYFGLQIAALNSITIDCTGHNAIIGAFRVNIAQPGGVVILRGVNVDGTFAGLNYGIWFERGNQLLVENCRITGFANNPVNANAGIFFVPSDASRLTVIDSLISVNGAANGTGGGIIIKPTGSGSARVALTRVNVANNTFGIAADGTGSTGGINTTIADSTVSGNLQDGIIAVTPGGGAPVGVMVKNTRSVNNTIGIRSIGPNVTVRVDGSSVIGNGTGLSFSGGGALLSAGNNMIQANGTNGAFSGSVGLQ